MKRRVVITGMGALTAVGEGADALWNAAVEGRSVTTRQQHYRCYQQGPCNEAVSLLGAIERRDPVRTVDAHHARRFRLRIN